MDACVHMYMYMKASCPQNPKLSLAKVQSLLLPKHTMLVTPIHSPCTYMCILSQPDTQSCGSGQPSMYGSEGGCMVGTLHSAPSPSSGNSVCVVTRPVVAESASAFLGLMLGCRDQEGSEEVVVFVVVLAAVDQQVNVFEG